MAGSSAMDAACATYEGISFEHDIFPRTKEPVWILGKEYVTNRGDDNTKITRDIMSRLWFTYRKNFPAIDWQWDSETMHPVYMQNFLDKKDSLYSIHQIELLCKGDWVLRTHCETTHNSCTSSERDRWRSGSKEGVKHRKNQWRPLLLFIPLRLGLSEMNSVYNEPFKACFKFRYSVGAIGGKPNHAYYFIGFYGNNLLFLDPHTTQQAVNPEKMSQIPDESYHCVHPSRINISDLDPSIALGFFCKTEEEFDDLCEQINEHILSCQRRPMFEVAKKRPPHWPSLELPQRLCDEFNCSHQSDFTELNYESDEEQKFDTDEEYEIL
ncbi:Cysteine protease ATG4B [Acropora cervicornis]|uniref:Cysteine protease n=1 Tax=Acropora cervicornis TaxID=6130 RepID=A0AAD9VGP4_ACRCE|nr:Cysteine protease ATG4B [Acropora cervicornis]